jgi:CubicO group peptidase (beta-lactamase class C family)
MGTTLRNLFPAALIVALGLGANTAISTAAAAETVSTSSGELEGLWKAKKRFGPDARGLLILRRNGAAFTADIAGRTMPVRTEKGELTFDLPDGQGAFRGKLESAVGILGHWFRPATAVNSIRFASPVILKPDGANRWSGHVAPLEDEFTFFLLLQKRPDGSLGAVLRNPEFDYGGQQKIERLVRDGNALKLIGKRGGKEQEVGVGTFDAENQVLTLAFPTRGGSYDFKRDGDESDFYPRGKKPGRYSYNPPTGLDDGWPIGTLDDANIDRAGLEKFVQKIIDMPMDSEDAPQIHSVLVARHGKLVLEEYFHGEHRDKLHDTRSASKSLVAVLVGAAIQAGAPLKLSSPVYEVMNDGAFPENLEAQKRAMTLEHLLTMSSGYFCDDTNDDAPGNEETMSNQTDEPDYYKYTLKVPMATPPGENSVYCSASPNLALGMLDRATGELPLYTFDRLVGGPMKFNRYGWYLDPAGHPYGGGGIRLLPRDFPKLGQLLLNGGTWDGRTILSREFVAQTMAPLYHLRNLTYGYLWWGEDFPYKDRTVRASMALGAGGQTVTVVPDLDLVIAIYSGNYSSRVVQDITHHYVPRSILPAVREQGDDKNAPVMEREYKSPHGRSSDGSRISRTK